MARELPHTLGVPGSVLHIAPFLWSGAGGVITRLCEAQVRRGSVVIVTTGASDDGQEDWTPYRRRLRRAGVQHHALDFFHRDAATFWGNVERLQRLIEKLQPRVIHAHAGVPTCAAVAACPVEGRRPRIIGQMYSWGPSRPAWMNQQDMWGFARADRVVCSARAYWDILVEAGIPTRRLAYLPWGLPLDELPVRDSRRAAINMGPTIGFVGRLEPRKGQLDLVEAFARIRRRHPDARLELVGPVADEDYATRIQAAIATHGLADAVTLTGLVRDVVSHVRQWDLFVSASADEGQGLAVLEAMAIGVPVVVRPVAGLVDFITADRTGFVIAQPTAKGIADAIEQAWTQPAAARSIARRARRLVEQRYAWDRMLPIFARLYANPLAGRLSPPR